MPARFPDRNRRQVCNMLFDRGPVPADPIDADLNGRGELPGGNCFVKALAVARPDRIRQIFVTDQRVINTRHWAPPCWCAQYLSPGIHGYKGFFLRFLFALLTACITLL